MCFNWFSGDFFSSTIHSALVSTVCLHRSNSNFIVASDLSIFFFSSLWYMFVHEYSIVCPHLAGTNRRSHVFHLILHADDLLYVLHDSSVSFAVSESIRPPIAVYIVQWRWYVHHDAANRYSENSQSYNHLWIFGIESKENFSFRDDFASVIFTSCSYHECFYVNSLAMMKQKVEKFQTDNKCNVPATANESFWMRARVSGLKWMCTKCSNVNLNFTH